jgi:hypothetical protein
MIRVFLKYGPDGEKVMTGLERISRPVAACIWERRRADRARRSRHQHPDDVSRGHDRPRRAQGGVGGKCSATSGENRVKGKVKAKAGGFSCLV